MSTPDARDTARTSAVDPADMLGAVQRLPDQIDAAWVRLADLDLPAAFHDVDGVAVLGMGGSAIGADLARSLTAGERAVPMEVVRDYRLPAWIGPRTLVIGTSFSGSTEETLSAFDAAAVRGARRVAVTSGGPLAERAHAAGAPVVELPNEGRQPRAALGDSLVSVLALLWVAGLIASPGPALAAASSAMRTLVAQSGADPEAGTDALGPAGLARDLVGRVPAVFAPQDIAPVARRWKTQFNENAETIALWDTLPELNHNTVVGLAFPPTLPAWLHVVILSAPGTPPRNTARIEATRQLLAERAIPHTLVSAPATAGPRLAEALWLLQYGDLTTVYLAHALGVDPTPVTAIDRLKAALGPPDESA